MPVSALLAQALAVACDAAERSAGTVDPTVGAALVESGYDRDFDDIVDRAARSAAGRSWRRAGGACRSTAPPSTAAVPDGVHIDLGATAKALAADLCAGQGGRRARLRCPGQRRW